MSFKHCIIVRMAKENGYTQVFTVYYWAHSIQFKWAAEFNFITTSHQVYI